MKIKNITYILSLVYLTISISNLFAGSQLVSNNRYITDEQGNIQMLVNIWGHVNKPGSHMVKDGIDIVSLLSIVGGPKAGTNLKKIKLYRQIPDDNGKSIYEINLEDFYETGSRDNFVKIKPNDTIIIPQKKTSYILSYTGTVNTFLQIINIYLQVLNKAAG